MRTSFVLIAICAAVAASASLAAGPAEAAVRDRAFGANGEVRLGLPRGARAAEVDVCGPGPHGTLTVVGVFSRIATWFPSSTNPMPAMMARIDAHGRVIRLAGSTWTPLSAVKGHSEFTRITVDSAGGLLYTYLPRSDISQSQQVYIRRMTPRGRADASFGRNGRIAPAGARTTDFHDATEYLALLNDGRIAWISQRGADSLISLFTGRGKPVDSFGDHGVLTLTGRNAYAIQSGVAGSLLVSTAPAAGRTPWFERTTILKLDATGAPVTEFGDHGEVRMPDVASFFPPVALVPLSGAVLAENPGGTLLTRGVTGSDPARTVTDGIIIGEELDEIDPARPAAPSWRSPWANPIIYSGDGGRPEYSTVQAFAAGGALFYAWVNGSPGPDPVWNEAHFRRDIPGLAPGAWSGVTRAQLSGLVPEFPAWDLDGQAFSVCGVPMTEAGMKTKSVLIRKWKV